MLHCDFLKNKQEMKNISKLKENVYFTRDLSSVRAEVTKSVRVVQGACMDLDKNLRGMDANTQSALEEERARRQKVWLSADSIKQYFVRECICSVVGEHCKVYF